MVTVFGVGVLAGNHTGARFDNRVGVLVVVEKHLGGGGADCFPFPLDTGGVGT